MLQQNGYCSAAAVAAMEMAPRPKGSQRQVPLLHLVQLVQRVHAFCGLFPSILLHAYASSAGAKTIAALSG
jgi:hypothetical protein